MTIIRGYYCITPSNNFNPLLWESAETIFFPVRIRVHTTPQNAYTGMYAAENAEISLKKERSGMKETTTSFPLQSFEKPDPQTDLEDLIYGWERPISDR